MRSSVAVLLAGLATVVSAKSGAYTLFTTGNNTEFYDMPINAIDGGFWINRHAKQFCPEAAKAHCSNGTNTVIHGTSDKEGGPISLGSLVPGSQDIFITKEGVLGYTKAHSNSIPKDATRNPKGFTFVPPRGMYVDLGRMKYPGGGFALCGPQDPILPTYQIYVDKGKLGSDCVPIEIGTRAHYGKQPVWQYD